VIFGGTIFQALTSIVPRESIALGELSGFVDYLRDKHARSLPDKNANHLICPSWFECTRNKLDVLFASGLWFDQDCKGGYLSVEEFASLLPDLHFVAFNTFSATQETRKYRIYLPTDRIMTGDEFDAALDSVLGKIAKKKPEHGFDLTPTSSASLFFLPCQARSGCSFFEERRGELFDVDAHVAEYREQMKWEDYYFRRPIWIDEKSETTIEEVQQALEKIPSDDRQVWFSVACALKHAYGDLGFAIWDSWSRKTTSNNYDARDQKRVWKSIRSDCQKPKTIASIVWLSKQYQI
jgi:hypothetical protein